MSNDNGRSRGQNGKQGGSKRKGRSRSRSKRVDPLKYWGDRDLVEIPETYVVESPDTSVVATSLGRPPIPGQENASRHYFSLVYDRAAMLAGALAAAGDIQNMAANAASLADDLAAEADDDTDSDTENDDTEDDEADGDDGAEAMVAERDDTGEERDDTGEERDDGDGA